MSSGRSGRSFPAIAAICTLVLGCATPRLFPDAPLPGADPNVRVYRVDREREFTEFLVDGRVAQIAYGGPAAARVDLAAARRQGSPHLLFILDSVPFELVREAWNAGRFRYFHPPGCIVSVFPAMTDPAIAEFFGVSPCTGVEAVHFDGRRLVTGYDSYLAETNAPWLKCVDFYLHPSDHVFAYLMPGTTFRRELAEAQVRFERFARDVADNSKSKIQNPKSADVADGAAAPAFVAYSVATSGLGSADGRGGHEYALEMLDRYCRQLIFDCRGDIQITLMSDHGHDFSPHQRIDIAAGLKKVGYRVGVTLEADNDVIVPAFGLVSCVAIHTQSAARVARDCLSIAGVELALFREGPSQSSQAISVLARGASARITRRENRYRYEALEGDPLKLRPLLAKLAADSDGFIDDQAVLRATIEHEFPDPLDRIWHAFNGNFVNTPDVFLSLENDAYAGSGDLAAWLDMIGVHGNLRAASSRGFVMTTRHALPAFLRMRDVRDALEASEPRAQARGDSYERAPFAQIPTRLRLGL